MTDEGTSEFTEDKCDAIVGRLLDELDRAGEPGVVIDDYARQHPECAPVIRLRGRDHLRLKASVPGGEPPLVIGDFRLAEKLGPSMGIVYRARQLSTGLTVVLKFRRGELANETAAHLIEEHRILARLADTGAHIVPLLTAGEEDGWHFLAMKHIKGASLREIIAALRSAPAVANWPSGRPKESLARFVTRIRTGRAATASDRRNGDSWPAAEPGVIADAPPIRRRRLPRGFIRAMVAMMADVADAVHAAHSLRFIHRDVKPSNVMVDATGQAWLIDFGLALRRRRLVAEDRAVFAKTAVGTGTDVVGESLTISGGWPDPDGNADGGLPFAGTPSYAAPEQLAGRPVAQSDVWGLGATLYEALTFCRPFEGDTLSKVRAAQTNPENPHPLGWLTVGAPGDLDAICHKAMARDLPDRYQTAAEFAADLRRWLHHEPTTVGPTWLGLRRLSLWVRREPGWAGLFFMTLVAAWLVNALWWRTDAALSRAAVEAQSREEIEVRRLISAAHVRLQSRMGDHVKHVLTNVVPEIAERTARLSRPDVATEIQLELRSLILAAQSEPWISTREYTALPITPNLCWPVAVHPQGNQFAIGSSDRPFRVVRGNEFAIPKDIKNVRPRPRVWYSPRGTCVLHAPATGGLSLWDESIQQKLGRWPFDDEQTAPTVLAIGFSAISANLNSPLAVVGNDGVIHQFSVPALTEDLDRRHSLMHVSRGLTCASFSQDSRLVAVGTDGGELFVFGDDHALECRFHTETQPVELTAWSQDGGLLAAGTRSGTIFVFDLARKAVACRFTMAACEPESIFFAPHRRLLFCTQRGRGTAVFDTVSGEAVLSGQQSIAGCSSDGLQLIRSDQGGVGFCDWRSPETVVRCTAHRHPPTVVSWAANSARFASLDSSFELCAWDAASGRLLRQVSLPMGDNYSDNSGLAMNDAGDVACIAYTARGDGIAYLWFIDTGTLVGPVRLPAAGYMRAVHRLQTHRFLVACEEERHAGLQDFQTVTFEIAADGVLTGATLLRDFAAGESGFLTQAISADGKHYVWVGPRHPDSAYRTEIWDLDRQVAIATLPYSMEGERPCQEARALLCDSGRDLWLSSELPEGQNLTSLRGSLKVHRATLHPVASSGDGKWQVRWKLSETAYPPVLFNLCESNGDRPLFRIFASNEWAPLDPDSVRFSPDCRKLVWGNVNGSLSLLDLDQLPRIVVSSNAPP